jgi:hypothetical protein
LEPVRRLEVFTGSGRCRAWTPEQKARNRGIVQCDGYAAYKNVANASCGKAITLAFCWAHLRRKFFDITRFLDDGRIELDTNIVERSIRPVVLNRKNALFAGHDQGAENWACIASLIETCKLYGVDPQTYLTDVLTKLVNLRPASRLDELMPWAWAAERATNKLAT